MKSKPRIGIIGCGNMGLAILEQSLKSHVKKIRLKPKNFVIFEKDKLREAFICKECHLQPARDVVDLTVKSDIVIIAVKPQDIDGVLDDIGEAARIRKKRKLLIISIAAGIRTEYIENKVGRGIAVVRAMPNMPASIGEGITALAGGRSADNNDLRDAKRIFEVFGPVIVVEKEGLINAVTAVSGSGPAYLFYIIAIILEAAQGLGLDKEAANKLVYHTIIGSMDLLDKNNFDARTLIARVASKGGTTEAALNVFKKEGLDRIISDAIKTAHKRAGELSR